MQGSRSGNIANCLRYVAGVMRMDQRTEDFRTIVKSARERELAAATR